jgi:hypothetical protein
MRIRRIGVLWLFGLMRTESASCQRVRFETSWQQETFTLFFCFLLFLKSNNNFFLNANVNATATGIFAEFACASSREHRTANPRGVSDGTPANGGDDKDNDSEDKGREHVGELDEDDDDGDDVEANENDRANHRDQHQQRILQQQTHDAGNRRDQADNWWQKEVAACAKAAAASKGRKRDQHPNEHDDQNNEKNQRRAMDIERKMLNV